MVLGCAESRKLVTVPNYLFEGDVPPESVHDGIAVQRYNEETHREHRMIVDAIEAGDKEQARRIIETHPH